MYERKPFQVMVALLILLNFLVSVVKNQMLPTKEQELELKVFQFFETFFNVAFCFELFVNMYGSFFFPFWRTGWNWFDFIIVGISLLSELAGGIPGINVLRLFRAFRVFRLFKRVKALRVIIEAVLKSIPSVANAFLVLGLIMSIWSIMAVSFFREEMPDHFGNFILGILTFFQIMTLDGWCSNITRVLVLKKGEFVAFFFLSYVFINSIMMANVVVAILLEKFISAMNAEEEQEEEDARKEGTYDADRDQLRQDKADLLAFEEMTMNKLKEISDCLAMAENHLKVLCPKAMVNIPSPRELS